MLDAPAPYQLVNSLSITSNIFLKLLVLDLMLLKVNSDRLFAGLQFLRHIMRIWQPSGLGSTWSRTPPTAGPWLAVHVVVVHRAVHAAAPGLGTLLSGLSPPSRKTSSASCFTAKILAVTVRVLEAPASCIGDAVQHHCANLNQSICCTLFYCLPRVFKVLAPDWRPVHKLFKLFD